MSHAVEGHRYAKDFLTMDLARPIAGFKPVTTTGGTTTLHYVHPDHLGGTNVVTDEDCLMAQAIDYYPYREKQITNGTDVSQREFIGEMSDETPDLSYLIRNITRTLVRSS
jgi:hypothetical protein